MKPLIKRVLIVGLGTLGRALLKSPWMEGRDVEAASRSGAPVLPLDLSKETAVRDFFRGRKYDLVVNCAAMTDVDGCEKSPAEARRVNALAVRDLARATRAARTPFIHVSTNYVFSGQSETPYRESDAAEPCSIYGLTKLEGEHHALHENPDAIVVRTSWIFGGTKRDFISHFLERFRSKEALEVVGDQSASLTYAPDLAAAIGEIALARAGRPGKGPRIIHVANRGALTRYDMLVEMKKILSKTNRIIKISQDKFKGWVAVRPRHSALSVARYESAFGSKLRSWQETLREHLAGEAAACAS